MLEFKIALAQNPRIGSSELLPFGTNSDLPWDWIFPEILMGYSSLLSPVGVYFASNLLGNYMQVTWFTLVWWYLYLDNCATNHTKFVTWLMDNVADADTTLLSNCNAEVTSSSLKG